MIRTAGVSSASMRLDLIGRKDLPLAFGRWRLTDLLGEGGMARVFRGELRGGAGFRKPAAVKVVLPGIGEKAAQLRRQLLQEARVGALLNHPNIVQTFDCGELEGYPFIAMELVEGVGLQELVQAQGRLPPGVALDMASQVASGLHHAHTAVHDGRELRVIHRDVKPSNILIRADGVAKVVDFGIAKAAVDDALSTSTGMTKGTPAYMSPEQLGAEDLDARSDLFALGAVLYYLLWGRTLFSGQSITEVMLRIIQVDETLAARGVFAEAESVAPGLGDALAKLLVKDRERRYPNAGVASKALAELRGRLPAHPTTSELISEYLSARDAGAVFGVASDSPGDAPRVEAARMGESDLTSGFRRQVEAAREGGVEWIESTAPDDAGPGATRLVPSVVTRRPPDAAPKTPTGGLADLSLPEVSSGGWTAGAPPAGIAAPRAMPSRPPRRPRRKKRKAAELEWERRRRRARRRVMMSGLVLGLVAVGFASWLGLRGSEAPPVASPAAEGIGTDAVAALTAGDELPLDLPPVDRSRPAASSSSAEPAMDAVADAGTAEPEPAGPADAPEEATTDLSVGDLSVGDMDAVAGLDEDPAAEPAVAEIDAGAGGAEAALGSRRQDHLARLEADDADPFDDDGLADAEAEEPEKKKASETTAARAAPPSAPLRMRHRPFTMATVGTSKTVQVYIAGPEDPTVVVHWGPKGAADRTLTLTRAGTGVWEGLLPITAELRDAGGLVYWVVVTHPDTTPKRLQSGSPDGPHEVVVY